ncbi:MAG TPA: hypothetical protein VF615_10620 [Longimicrobiaceae bacterium]|jgi:hypothetical protein
MNAAYLLWSANWLLAAAVASTILCRLSAARLGAVLRFVGPPTVLVVTPALLGWSSRFDTFDRFLFPVLVFCTSLVVTAGMLLAFKRLDRGRRALRWIAGLLITVYGLVQAAACTVTMLGIAVTGGLEDGRDRSAGPLGDGYFYRQHLSGTISSDFLHTVVLRVPPLLPFLERRVAESHVKLTGSARENTGGRGNRRLVVMYGGSAVDQLVY